MKGYICSTDSTGWNNICLFGDFDVVVDLCVEFLYLWVRRGRGAEAISFNNELFGGFSEVWYHVRDVTLGDVV